MVEHTCLSCLRSEKFDYKRHAPNGPTTNGGHIFGVDCTYNEAQSGSVNKMISRSAGCDNNTVSTILQYIGTHDGPVETVLLHHAATQRPSLITLHTARHKKLTCFLRVPHWPVSSLTCFWMATFSRAMALSCPSNDSSVYLSSSSIASACTGTAVYTTRYVTKLAFATTTHPQKSAPEAYKKHVLRA